jgi:hypothetical protein
MHAQSYITPAKPLILRQALEDWIGAYEELEYVPEATLDLGNGVVYAVVSQKARPVGVTGYVQQREGMVEIIEEGLIVRLIVYPQSELDEARAAAERLALERADG